MRPSLRQSSTIMKSSVPDSMTFLMPFLMLYFCMSSGLMSAR